MDRLIGLDLTENAVSGVGQLRTYDAGILIVSKNTLEILQDLRSAYQPTLHVYQFTFLLYVCNYWDNSLSRLLILLLCPISSVTGVRLFSHSSHSSGNRRNLSLLKR